MNWHNLSATNDSLGWEYCSHLCLGIHNAEKPGLLERWTSWEKWLWAVLQGAKCTKRHCCAQISDIWLPFTLLKVYWLPRVEAKDSCFSKRLTVSHWQLAKSTVSVFEYLDGHFSLRTRCPALCVLLHRQKHFPWTQPIWSSWWRETQGPLPHPQPGCLSAQTGMFPRRNPTPTPAYVCFPSLRLLSLPLTLTKLFAIAK